MTVVSINPHDPAHIAAIADIWTAACGPDLALAPRLVEYNLRPAAGTLQVGQLALRNNRPVGFVLASSITNDPAAQTGWIDAIAVLPDFQKQGIGSALLAWAEDWLTQQHCVQFRLGGSLRPFAPGLPLELNTETFFRARGYDNGGRFEWDVACDLADLQNVPRTCVRGTFEPGQPGQENDLLNFLEREFPGRWKFEFTEFLREHGRMSDYLLLWTDNGLDGFARLTLEDSERPIERFYMHRLPRPWGQLGPLGIGRACRGRGYGVALVDAALRHLQHLGVRGCVIDWTGLVDFYARFGFAPYRQYAILIKRVITDQPAGF